MLKHVTITENFGIENS